MTHDASTGWALFALRLTIFLLMIVWASLKLLMPEAYVGIYKGFYGLDTGISLVYALGALQILFLLAYALGLFKFVTTGGVMLMNLASMVVSFPKMADLTADKANILFIAAIPVFGASLAHFLMRKNDTFLSLGK